MKNFKIIQLHLLLFKAIGYRALRFLVNTLVCGLILKDWKFAIGFSLMLQVIGFLMYFIYDYLFIKFFRLSKDKGCVVWFTGLPCSGKSTIANEVHKRLVKYGARAERLDGDIIRKENLSNDLGFSKEDRDKNIKRVTFVSKVLSRQGVIVLASFVSPYVKTRQFVRENTTNFIEVFVQANADECARRDVKGMWKLAKEGKIKGFTGYDDPYHISDNSEVICNTQEETIEESTDKVIKFLAKNKLI